MTTSNDKPPLNPYVFLLAIPIGWTIAAGVIYAIWRVW